MSLTRRGFTLIELLIVVVLMGILAAIAIPKFARTKERGYFVTMEADLRNLVTSQEAYAGEYGAYMPAATVTVSDQYPGSGYSPSSGVTVVIDEPGFDSWSATATHMALPGATCGIFIGDEPPGGDNPAAHSGEPKCQSATSAPVGEID